MRTEYLAVYQDPAGATVEYPLVKEASTRAYRLSCGDGLRPIRWYLHGGLEFLTYRLARGSLNRLESERFMKMLLTPPVKPNRKPEEFQEKSVGKAL